MPPPDRYTCEQVFRRIDDYLDRELAPPEVAQVRAHLETCTACAREYAFEEKVLQTVKAKLRRVALPPEVRQRIERRMVDARDARAPRD